MKILISGGSGFVGSNLTKLLLKKGYEVTVMARNPAKGSNLPPQVKTLAADAMKAGPWQDEVALHDAVVNLAGVSVNKRWDDDHKKMLRDSRVFTTRNVVNALSGEKNLAKTLINASGVGFYGYTKDEQLSENAPPGKSDFLSGLAQDWENEAIKAKDYGVRLVIARIGIVLGRDGGALAEMARPFRFFVGGPLGDGKQWFPWIHVRDLCRAILFAIENNSMSGPMNCVSPNPVRNLELAQAIGKAMGRPSFFTAPAFMIKLILGEFGSVILEGQRAIPQALLENGFKFEFINIDDALRDIL
ncbi:MAG: TIGR01777 family oxidoreductase [Pseudomonadota bacterium]